MLRWAELEEVVLDVEVALNKRPLRYLEDDVNLPVLTPHSMLHINPSYLLELESHDVIDKDLRKRAKYLIKCKEIMWNLGTREYLRSLREQHRQAGGEPKCHPYIGDIVTVKDENKNRHSWKLDIVSKLIKGRDGIVRGAQLKTTNGSIERQVQLLYHLEQTCDRQTDTELDPKAPEFRPLSSRPRRDAAVAAAVRMQDIAAKE